MPRAALTDDGTHLQRFVRYELSRIIPGEQWWGVNDLNTYWLQASRFRPINWNVDRLESAVNNINTTGRGPTRIERREAGHGPEFRQTAEDRQRHPPREPNPHRAASRYIVHWLRCGNQSDTWIQIARVLEMLHETDDSFGDFTEDFIRMNCVQWADGRLEMCTDEATRTTYLRATRRVDRDRGAGRSRRSARPSATYSLSDSTALREPMPAGDSNIAPVAVEDGFVHLNN